MILIGSDSVLFTQHDSGGADILVVNPKEHRYEQMNPEDGSKRSAAPSVVFVVMAGGFSPPPVSVATGCVVLDLHLTQTETVLDRWLAAISTLDCAGVAGEHLCLCGGSTMLPQNPPSTLRIVTDKSDYRGPAGALRDACEAFAPETTIIAVEAARCCCINLGDVLAHHVRTKADVTVTRNPDKSPGGIYVLARRMLDAVPHAGFIDLKEQWLAKLIEQDARVMVCDIPAPGTMLLHTREAFLAAVRTCNGIKEAQGGVGLAPRILHGTRHAASVICPDARVEPDAVVVDALVSPGAVIGAGALVARSIVGPGAIVAPGAQVIDAVAGPTGIVQGHQIRREGSLA